VQIEAERDAFVAAAATADFREGIAAFFARRPARFGDTQVG
jgi:2-(1,2-epoxy-1,2-dihydrophenyl)acetyl-CoA isomerase